MDNIHGKTDCKIHGPMSEAKEVGMEERKDGCPHNYLFVSICERFEGSTGEGDSTCEIVEEAASMLYCCYDFSVSPSSLQQILTGPDELGQNQVIRMLASC